jgi:hypothetical protein
LRHAEYICTDSFHGTVFAELFNRQFTAFYRSESSFSSSSSSMNSRIDTLLDKLNLTDRIYGVLSAEQSMQNIDYEETGRYIKPERDGALKYLREIAEK